MRKQPIARTGYANNADTVWKPRGKKTRRSNNAGSVGKRGKSPGYTGSPFRTVKVPSIADRPVIEPPVLPAPRQFKSATSCGLQVHYAREFGPGRVLCVTDWDNGVWKNGKKVISFACHFAAFDEHGRITLGTPRRVYPWRSKALTWCKGYEGEGTVITLRSSDMTLDRHLITRTDRSEPTIDITG
tara:strand:- start:921 stop:1478 length:558 start_codon:yes stop_codon:yes gene_type:complete